MYLPTFWKLTTEAYGYKLRHMAGWALPAGMFSKYSFCVKLPTHRMPRRKCTTHNDFSPRIQCNFS